MNKEWELLQTGIPLIDQQHKAYSELTKELFCAAEQGNVTKNELALQLQAVLRYAVEHFDAEEFVMQSADYPLLDDHRKQHDVFRCRTDKLLQEFEDTTDLDQATISLSRWLIEWFCLHVKAEDNKLALYLQQRNCPA